MSARGWEQKPLGAVADLCLGKMLDQKKNRGELMPYLANVNVRWGEFVLDDLRTMRFEAKELDRYGLKFGDIVMCEGGEPGRCAIWKNKTPQMMIQKALHRIRPKECLDYRFLYYNLLYIGQTKVFDQYFTGSTIKHLPSEKLAKVEVLVPPVDIQRRIASVLSAYDDLIENNTRRIAILEEMARRIYEEWFVRFRFPGHERVKMVESELGLIPDGWRSLRIGDYCDVTDYVANGSFASLKENVTYCDEPNYAILVRTKDYSAAWNGSFVYVTEESYRFLKKSALTVGDIVVGNVGNAGMTFRVPDLGQSMTLGPNAITVRPKSHRAYVYEFLCSNAGQHLMKGIVSGAAQPKFNKTEFRKLFLPLPSDEILTRYEEIAESLWQLRENLRKQNANLRATRDLLLPKLISGELDVSTVPEPEEAIAA